jgi:uncharacterized membrane protein YhaH (DUF805 family)
MAAQFRSLHDLRRTSALALVVALAVVLPSLIDPAFSQQTPLPPNTVTGVATGAAPVADNAAQRSLTGFFSSRTPYEFWLTVLNVGFGISTLGIVLFVFRKLLDQYAEQLIRFAIVVVIVIGTLVLITAGFSNEQVAPAFGLFGTIVGYILGRMSSPPASPAAQPPPAGGSQAP